LGDYISDCPYPDKTMHLIDKIRQKYPTWCIRGNREDYMLSHRENPEKTWKKSSSSGSLLYTYRHLREQDLDFFKQLPIVREIEISGYPPLTICHGSPASNCEILYSGETKTKHYLEELKTDYLLCAHNHSQKRFQFQGKEMWNCGSAGIPLGGRPLADFMYIEGNSNCWKPEFISLPYDIEAVIQEFEESGLNQMSGIFAKVIIKQLRTGINYLDECIQMAKTLAQQQKEDIRNGIPEKYWEEAAACLKI
jgi:hypothetical protein